MTEKMGVKQSLVSRWESSECNYTIDTLVEIADALGLSVRCPLTFNEAEVPTIPVEERPAGRKVEFPAVSFSDSARLISKWRADRFLNRITKGVLPDGCSSAQMTDIQYKESFITECSITNNVIDTGKNAVLNHEVEVLVRHQVPKCSPTKRLPMSG